MGRRLRPAGNDAIAGIRHNRNAMRLEKRTYTLPPDILQKFESRLPPGERSSSLAKIIEEWLDEREREELRQLIVEGCQDMWAEYETITREWEPAADEVWLNDA